MRVVAQEKESLKTLPENGERQSRDEVCIEGLYSGKARCRLSQLVNQNLSQDGTSVTRVRGTQVHCCSQIGR